MVTAKTNGVDTDRAQRQDWLSTYRAYCHDYQLSPSPDVLTCFRLGLPDLVLHKWRFAAPFGDLDLQPLVDMFDTYPEALAQLRSISLPNAKLGPAGTALLASQLKLPHCRVQELGYTKMWPHVPGVEALMDAAQSSASLTSLDLSRCHLCDDGAETLLAALRESPQSHGLKKLNLQKNGLSFDAVTHLRQACACSGIEVDLSGNHVLHEVLNAVSHGLGIVLSVLGTMYMMKVVRGKPTNYVASVVVYGMSLFVLYLSSTLFHAFQSLGPKVMRIFGILDHAAIFFLIAGSFCPFIWIHLPHATWLLVVLFATAFLGVGITATYTGAWKPRIMVSLYLLMGWSVLLYVRELSVHIGDGGTFLLILGGVLYSAGVPFFVKEKRTLGLPDHTIWHLFVIAGSVSHYLCILWYCLSKEPACPDGRCAAIQ